MASEAHAARSLTHSCIHSFVHLCIRQTWLSVAGCHWGCGWAVGSRAGASSTPSGPAVSEDRDRRGPAPPLLGVPEGRGELGRGACLGPSALVHAPTPPCRVRGTHRPSEGGTHGTALPHPSPWPPPLHQQPRNSAPLPTDTPSSNPPVPVTLCQRCQSALPVAISGQVTDVSPSAGCSTPHTKMSPAEWPLHKGHIAAAGQWSEEALWATLTPALVAWGSSLTLDSFCSLPPGPAPQKCPLSASPLPERPGTPPGRCCGVASVANSHMPAPPSLFPSLFCQEGAGPTPGPTPGRAAPHCPAWAPASLPTRPSSMWSFPLDNLQGETLGLSSDRQRAAGILPGSTFSCEPPAAGLRSESATHFEKTCLWEGSPAPAARGSGPPAPAGWSRSVWGGPEVWSASSPGHTEVGGPPLPP